MKRLHGKATPGRRFFSAPLNAINRWMAYYHDHQDDIDAEIQAELDQLENGPDSNANSPVWLKLKAKCVI